MIFDRYELNEFFDEMFLADGTPRPGARLLKEKFESLPEGDLLQPQIAAERLFLESGITFNVYGDGKATEKNFRSTSFLESSKQANGTGSRKASNKGFTR